MSGLLSGFPVLRCLTLVASGLLLAGCSADQYFMVEKRDISQLDNAVSAQGEQIDRLEEKNLVQLGNIAMQNQASTESILAAINEQAEQFSCPPPPRQPACDITSADQQQESTGRDDRLKGKIIVGKLENFLLVEPGLVHIARIDSGAETSSLDARNITRFERDGSNWVRFDVPLPDSDDFMTLESEVSRRVKIIQATADTAERRVVVELQFMIGDHRQQAEFTLTNREHLSQVVLVGRNILRDVMLIDVGKEFATELPSPLPNQNNDDSP